MKASAVCVEMVKELHCRDGGVERACVAKVAIPNLIHSFMDKLGNGAFRSVIGGVILEEEGMFCFAACAYNGGGIVCNCWICRWLHRDRRPA